MAASSTKIESLSGSAKVYKTPKTEIRELTAESAEYLLSRGLTKETLAAFRVGSTQRGNIAIPFFDENNDLRLIKFRHATGEMLDLSGRPVKTYIEPGGMPILLGSHLAHPSEGPLVVTFGDYDAMSLYQAGIPNAVSVPFGDVGLDWITTQWEFLDSFAEIVLFPDIDNYKNPEDKARSQGKMNELVRRLGLHRVKVVSEKDRRGAKDANEILKSQGPDRLQHLVDSAVEFPVDGLVRVSDWHDESVKEGRPTGYDFIDRNAGGFGKGELILIAGDNNAGKTTFVLNLIANSVNIGVPAFFWSGEQNVGRIRYWFERIAAGPGCLKQVVNQSTQFKYHFPHDEYLPYIRDWYRDWFFQYKEFMPTPEQFFSVAETAIRRYGCRLIVIDNLMAFTGGEGDGYYQSQGDFAQSCKMFAEQWEVTVVLIVHNRKKSQQKSILEIEVPRKEDVEGSQKVTNWADMVLQMYRLPPAIKAEDQSDRDGIISLCKNRESGQMGEASVMIDLASNRIAETYNRDMLTVSFGWQDLYKNRGLYGQEDDQR